MADDFDPDAFLAFNPDEFLKGDAAPVPTGRERQHSYLESLRAGSTETPAGQDATGPDLSSERRTAGQLGEEYGQVGKGMLKGIPATLSGGIGGDIESMGRGAINALRSPQNPIVSKDTVIPTTTEGGYLGPKGANVMAPAANPLEAAGMGISSALIPFAPKMLRGRVPPPLEGLPPPPPGGSMAYVRNGSNARLIPPEVPHVAPVASGSRDLGASGAGGPLEGVSPDTMKAMRDMFAEEGVTPWTAEQRLSEMSPHQALGEFSPNTESHMGAVAAPPGQGKLEVINFLKQRALEAPERLKNTFDRAFGENEDLAQLRRVIDIDQKKAADPFYKKWRETSVPMTEDLQNLMPRLEAANAFGVAKHKAALEGIPWQQPETSSYGPITGEASPTAQTWDYVKRALDHKIDESFDKHGKATDYTRIYTQLKNEMVDALDNHPNPQVAGVWKQGRDAYAGPAKIKDAMRFGQKILNGGIDSDEIKFMTASYSPSEMAGLRKGIRNDLENQLGKPGNQELPTIKKILGGNNQKILREVLGDDQADELINGIQHEFNMHGSPQRIHGGSQTALRAEANKRYVPQGMSAADVLDTGVGLLTNTAHGVVNLARKAGVAKLDAAKDTKFARMREELARLHTLQGPERDAVVRYFTQPEDQPRAKGGSIIHRASGGKAVGHKPSRPLLMEAKAAKVAKSSVSYSHGMASSHCGICMFYENRACSKVSGAIDPEYWCRLFRRRKYGH